jgi:chromosome partitioning protein
MIISLASKKGGGGKSTVSVALAAEWQSRGLRVALIDADPQQTSLTWSKVAAQTGNPRPVTVGMTDGQLHEAGGARELARDYDVTIIDCPPANAPNLRSALLASDLVILPVAPSPTDLWSLANSIELVKEAARFQPELRGAVLINRKDPRTSIGRVIREALQDCGLPTLESELCNRVDYPESFGLGQGPTTYKRGGLASLEVQKLAQEIEELTGLRGVSDAAE